MDKENLSESSEEIVGQRGFVSNQLFKDGVENESLGNDHIGVEVFSVKPEKLYKAISYLRQDRNFLLAETDWTASSDLTMSAEMKTYRQQLRDATNGLDTVKKIEAYTFPKKVEK